MPVYVAALASGSVVLGQSMDHIGFMPYVVCPLWSGVYHGTIFPPRRKVTRNDFTTCNIIIRGGLYCNSFPFGTVHAGKESTPSQPPEENRGEKRKHNEELEKEVTEEKNEEEKKVCKGFPHFHTQRINKCHGFPSVQEYWHLACSAALSGL